MPSWAGVWVGRGCGDPFTQLHETQAQVQASGRDSRIARGWRPDNWRTWSLTTLESWGCWGAECPKALGCGCVAVSPTTAAAFALLGVPSKLPVEGEQTEERQGHSHVTTHVTSHLAEAQGSTGREVRAPASPSWVPDAQMRGLQGWQSSQASSRAVATGSNSLVSLAPGCLLGRSGQ